MRADSTCHAIQHCQRPGCHLLGRNTSQLRLDVALAKRMNAHQGGAGDHDGSVTSAESGTSAEMAETGAALHDMHIDSSSDNTRQPGCTLEWACSKRSDSNDSNFFWVGRYGDLALRLGSGITQTAVYT